MFSIFLEFFSACRVLLWGLSYIKKIPIFVRDRSHKCARFMHLRSDDLGENLPKCTLQYLSDEEKSGIQKWYQANNIN